MLVQFNSRPKARIMVDATLNAKQIEELALHDEKVVELLNGAAVKKVIVIPNRLINVII